jgi:hypothetical protein
MPSLNSPRPLGSWLLDPLAAPSSGPSILQKIVQSRAGGRRPRHFRNMTLGSPTAKFDSRHGNISTALRVVGDSVPAVATIRFTTHGGNIVIELVSQNLRLTSGRLRLVYGFLSDIALQVSKSPSRMVHIDAYSQSGKFKTHLSISVSEYPKRGSCARILLSSPLSSVD